MYLTLCSMIDYFVWLELKKFLWIPRNSVYFNVVPACLIIYTTLHKSGPHTHTLTLTLEHSGRYRSLYSICSYRDLHT